jgi:hypothetical protein
VQKEKKKKKAIDTRLTDFRLAFLSFRDLFNRKHSQERESLIKLV